MTGTTVFGCLCDSFWGEPLLDPKKLQNQQFYIIDWIRKKLLVDVANLATCWTNGYDILLEVLGTLGRIYVSRPVAKTSVLDWKSWLAQLFFGCLCDSFWGEPLLDPKKLQNQEFYMIDWIRKNSWSMLPIWLLAELTVMKYYWRFWEPWAGSMLVVLLPKHWFWIENHDWHNCFWMSLWLFVGWTLTGPKKKLQNQQF